MGENCKQIASCYILNPVSITQQLMDRASAASVAGNYFSESQLRTHFVPEGQQRGWSEFEPVPFDSVL